MTATAFVVGSVLALFQAAPRAAAPVSDPADRAVVATIDGASFDAATFARFVLAEREHGGDGADALEHLVQERLVELESTRRNLVVTKSDVAARLADLEQQVRKETEGKAGLDEYLAAKKIDPVQFRAQLPSAIACERMMREDYGLAADKVVPAEKQSLWFQDLKTRAGVKTEGVPAGVGATIGAGPNVVTISRTAWGLALFHALGAKEADALFSEFVDVELLLAQARREGVEVTPKLVKQEVDALTRDLVQKLKENGQPTDGVDYPSMLKSRGEDPDAAFASDRFKAGVVLNELTRRRHGKEGFRKYYDDHRATFDAAFGRRVRLATIFLRAAQQKSAKVTRTWTEAQEELDQLGKKIRAGDAPLPESFASEARLHSEHSSSARGGDLGLLSQPQLDPLGFTPDWRLLDQKAGALVGPITTADGVHLLLVGESKAASPFEEIAADVEKAARHDLLVELRKAAKVERKI